MPKSAAIDAIYTLTNWPTLSFVEPWAVQFALTKAAQGADFADMLHLALSGGADVFATFDKGIEPFAAGAPVPVKTLQA